MTAIDAGGDIESGAKILEDISGHLYQGLGSYLYIDPLRTFIEKVDNILLEPILYLG